MLPMCYLSICQTLEFCKPYVSIALMSKLNDIKMFKNFKVAFWDPATLSRPLGIVSLLTLSLPKGLCIIMIFNLSGLTACPEK